MVAVEALAVVRERNEVKANSIDKEQKRELVREQTKSHSRSGDESCLGVERR
jgi:hypothetical protein